jgi:hypothetical protein
VVHINDHFVYAAVRYDPSHPQRAFCVIGDSLAGSILWEYWGTLCDRLTVMVQALVLHWDLPKCSCYDIFIDLAAQQKGSDCAIFAGVFAARRLCGVKVDVSVPNRPRISLPPVSRVTYASAKLRSVIIEVLRGRHQTRTTHVGLACELVKFPGFRENCLHANV